MFKLVLSFFKVLAFISLLILVGVYSAYLYEKKLVLSEVSTSQLEVMQGVKRFIELRLSEVIFDIDFLSQQAPVIEYLSSNETEALEKLKPVVSEMLRSRAIYDNVRFVGLDGKEKVRASWNGKDATFLTSNLITAEASADYLSLMYRQAGDAVNISFMAHNASGVNVNSPSSVKLRLSLILKAKEGQGLLLILDVDERSMFSGLSHLSDAVQTDTLLLNPEGFLFYASSDTHTWEHISKDYIKFYNMNAGTSAVYESFSSPQVWRDGDLWTYSTLNEQPFERWKVLMLLQEGVIAEKLELLTDRFKVTLIVSLLLAAVLAFVYSKLSLRADQLSQANEKYLAQVSEAENLLSLFITHVPAAVAMVDKDMRYIAVSNRWLEDFRLTGDVLGSTHYDVFPLAPSYWKSVYQRCFDGAVEYCDEEKLKHADGVIDWVRWEVRPWYTAKSEIGGLVMLMEVITTRKQAAAARDEFVAKVSHELRTPLTAIMGGLKLLQANVFGQLEPGAAEILSIAERNSQRLLYLVNDLLDMQKIRLDEIGLDFENVAIKSVVDESIKAVALSAQERNVNLKLIDESFGVKVNVDEKRLSQVVVNLLLNAIRHTPEGGEVVVKTIRSYKEVMVSVVDGGSGVPEGLKRNIFDDFAQDEEGNVRTPGGTGLGLAIAKSLIERFGGNISFHNRPEGGAEFYFTLPELASA